MYACHNEAVQINPKKFFIYCRKSSEDENRQMLSIDAQLSQMELNAQREGLTVVSTFTESRSAKEAGREVFNDMLRRIEHGEADAILTWKLDRLARNFDDGGKIIGMLQRGVIKEIRTFEKSYLPSDNVLTIAVELGMANQYVRDLSVNIKNGIREKIRRGVFYGKAPLGYLNEPRLRTIEPHPEDFSKMKRILELFATGQYSLTAIRREMAAVGLIGSRNGKPPALSSLSKLFHNPFFYGVFTHKGEMHPGVHVPMISKKVFDDIQTALVAVGKPRKRRAEKGFLFTNFATCGCCGYSILAERHVKKSGLRFDYYRCSHKGKKQRCDNRVFIRQERFAAEVKRNVGLVTIPEEWKERFLARIETWEGQESETRQEHVSRLNADLAEVKAKIDRINNGFADGALDVAEFKELKNPLIPRKTELEQQIVALERAGANRLEPLRNWVLEANQAETWAQQNNWLEMKSFLQKVGSNRLLRGETLTVAFKKPHVSLAETNLAVRSTDDATARNSRWWSRGESNP
jgi:site-specific DNA recombinase